MRGIEITITVDDDGRTSGEAKVDLSGLTNVQVGRVIGRAARDVKEIIAALANRFADDGSGVLAGFRHGYEEGIQSEPQNYRQRVEVSTKPTGRL